MPSKLTGKTTVWLCNVKSWTAHVRFSSTKKKSDTERKIRLRKWVTLMWSKVAHSREWVCSLICSVLVVSPSRRNPKELRSNLQKKNPLFLESHSLNVNFFLYLCVFLFIAPRIDQFANHDYFLLLYLFSCIFSTLPATHTHNHKPPSNKLITSCVCVGVIPPHLLP